MTTNCEAGVKNRTMTLKNKKGFTLKSAASFVFASTSALHLLSSSMVLSGSDFPPLLLPLSLSFSALTSRALSPSSFPGSVLYGLRIAPRAMLGIRRAVDGAYVGVRAAPRNPAVCCIARLNIFCDIADACMLCCVLQ